nr:hypothetical protein [Tanacetum cinerariifolium]
MDTEFSPIPIYGVFTYSIRRIGPLVNRVHILDFEGLAIEMRQALTDRSIDQEVVNLPYLFAYYLFSHAKRRKSRAHMSEGHFIARLADHFRLLMGESLQELTFLDWVASGPERQPITAVGALEVTEGAPIVDEGVLDILAPVQNVRNQNGLTGVQWNGNQNQIGNGNLVAARAEGNVAGQNGNQIRCYNCKGVGHYARNCTVKPRRRDVAYLQTQLLIAQKEEAGIQLQAKEYDLMAAAADLDEIEEVNANCILMANLQQASTSGTQNDSALVYDTDGSAENDNVVISEDTSVEQGGEIVEQHPAKFEETCALYESLY